MSWIEVEKSVDGRDGGDQPLGADARISLTHTVANVHMGLYIHSTWEYTHTHTHTHTIRSGLGFGCANRLWVSSRLAAPPPRSAHCENPWDGRTVHPDTRSPQPAARPIPSCTAPRRPDLTSSTRADGHRDTGCCDEGLACHVERETGEPAEVEEVCISNKQPASRAPHWE